MKQAIGVEKIKILIAEDEERIRDMIKEYTSLEEFQIDEASDGVDALNLTKQVQYSLVREVGTVSEVLIMNIFSTLKRLQK